MGLESLFAFTLLGGAAAGAYVFETCFAKDRQGERPWLCVLVVVALFAIGMGAASTHVQSIPHAFAALGAGTVNFGSGMVKEVAVSGLFFILALVDLIIVFAKKSSPYALRVVTAVVGVVAMVLMGAAYIDVYGNEVWSNAPATVIAFISGDLVMGLGIACALGCADISNKQVSYALVGVCAALVAGLGLEIVAFSSVGTSIVAQVVGLIVGAIAPAVCALAGSKLSNQRTIAWLVCILAVVGVGVARYAFYATYAL